MTDTAPMSTDIQRVLFLGRVHCYQIPPLPPKGHKAADWNIEDPKAIIFTARVRIIESSAYDGTNVRTDIRLEDANTGDLFANGPYEVTFYPNVWILSFILFGTRIYH